MQTRLKDGSVLISGYVPADAEIRHVGQDKQYLMVTFSVKVGERDTGGERPDAIWCDCKAWRELGKRCSIIKKGDTVFCIGRLEQSTGQDGKVYTSLNCEFVSRGMPPLDGAGEIVQRAEKADVPVFEDDPDGDLPF